MVRPFTLGVRPSAQRVSLHEPVFLECTFVNPASEALQIDLGAGAVEAFRLTVEAVADLCTNHIHRKAGGFARDGDIQLASRGTHVERVLLQDWFRFPAPGRYIVTAGLQIAEASVEATPFALDVLPYDADRLRRACEGLVAQATSDPLPEAAEAAHALARIAHPIVVPFLEQLIQAGPVQQRLAILGLREVGNSESRSLLVRLSGDRNDETAALARRALRSGEWGVVAD